MPAPTPGRCPLWGTCTPHTPCRIAEKPSCNTARSRAQLRPPRGIYRTCFAPLLALAVSSNPSWPRGASCISTQGHRWSEGSIPALSLHTARGFQPSACKALQQDLFQRCQEHAARSSVSPGPGPSPLAAGERSQVLLLLSVGREHLPPAPARTHPTDSASGFVDSSETKTWQANLWSAGCLVMNPKYLRAERAGENGVSGQAGTSTPSPQLWQRGYHTPAATSSHGPGPHLGCETHSKAAPRMKLWLTGKGEPSGWGCWKQEGSKASMH